jgi:arginase
MNAAGLAGRRPLRFVRLAAATPTSTSLECDVLDDALMPAVDYRLPDGLHWDEPSTVLGPAFASGTAIGIESTIFNPTLEADGSRARALLACLVPALAQT